MPANLVVIMYHYVRDLPRTQFPRLKGMLTGDFRRQVDFLRERYEMATLESALAFWRGEYTPTRDLCLLTFDDGLKDHYTDVLPILVERKIQGLFFIITTCLEEQRVVSVHKNHFLMAALDFEAYRQAFLRSLAKISPDTDVSVDMTQAKRTYRWDNDEVAVFKYLLNHRLTEGLRDQILNELFQEHLGDESDFARQLYLSWGQTRAMQRAGMIIGGHSHKHVPLAGLAPDEQQRELGICTTLLRQRLDQQAFWPFSYPYGKTDTFDRQTVRILQQNGVACAFSSVSGETRPRDDVYALRRVDAKSLYT